MRTTKFAAFAFVLLFATPALAGFGGLGGVKVPNKPKGNAEDVTKFVQTSDVAYQQVRTLSADVPMQISELSDGILGLKDMPLDDAGKAKLAELKKEVEAARGDVLGTKVHDVKGMRKAHDRLDKSVEGLLGFLKETLSLDSAKQALGAAKLDDLKGKTKGYIEQDSGTAQAIAGKLLDAGKAAPAAGTAYGIGLGEDYATTLADGTQVKAKELNDLVKDGSGNVSLWKGYSEKRLGYLKQLSDIAGLK